MKSKVPLMLFVVLFLNQISIAGILKKISIVKTNNAPYFLYSATDVFAESDLLYLSKLKELVVKHGFIPKEESEIKFVLSALAWVNDQWDHDGMNQPPKNFKALDILNNVYDKKEKYRCVEFGLVLSEVLQSYGFVTRTLALRTTDVAYGGYGQGHVAMEVWINSLNKWIFLDGQFGTYLTKKDIEEPLNFYEAYFEKSSGRWENLQVHFVKKTQNNLKNASDYKDFLVQYFGHISTSKGRGKPRISLLLESKDMPITFQGGPLDDLIFTKDVSLFYPEMNRVSLTLSYQGKNLKFQDVIKKLNIKTAEEYFKNMFEFAAVPNFKIHLYTTTPFFEKYEYKSSEDKEWHSIKDGEFNWNATKQINRIEVRTINKFGRSGPITFMEISYK